MTTTMENFIKKVRKRPCLWDYNHLAYRENSTKDAAWEEVALECGMKNGVEAKFTWQKLRDSHREAMRRRRTSNHIKTPWKYEEQMRFIQVMSDQLATGKETTELQLDGEESYTQTLNIDFNESVDSPFSSSSNMDSEPENKVTVQMFHQANQMQTHKTTQEDFRSQESTNQQDALSKDALSILFESMCQKTRLLPKQLQLRVQREVFEAVLRAEEEALALDPLGAIHSSCSLNPQQSSNMYGPSSSTRN